MGGAITVVYRRPTGEVISRIKWTNYLPSLFTDVRFFAKNDEWLMEYMNEGNDFHENTPEAFSQMPIAPSEYGIVVIDFIKDLIISWNHYCSPCCFNHYWIENPDMFDPSPVSHIEELIKHKKIRGIEFNVFKTSEKAFLPLDSCKSFKEMADAVAAFKKKEDMFGYAQLDISPFSIKTFNKWDASKERIDIHSCKDLIKEIGIEISASDEDIWNSYFRVNNQNDH